MGPLGPPTKPSSFTECSVPFRMIGISQTVRWVFKFTQYGLHSLPQSSWIVPQAPYRLCLVYLKIVFLVSEVPFSFPPSPAHSSRHTHGGGQCLPRAARYCTHTSAWHPNKCLWPKVMQIRLRNRAAAPQTCGRNWVLRNFVCKRTWIRPGAELELGNDC